MSSAALSPHMPRPTSVLAVGSRSSAARGASLFLQLNKTSNGHYQHGGMRRRTIAHAAWSSTRPFQQCHAQFASFQPSRVLSASALSQPSAAIAIVPGREAARRYQHQQSTVDADTESKNKTAQSQATIENDKKAYDKVNPPATTRPAPLDLPPSSGSGRGEGQGEGGGGGAKVPSPSSSSSISFMKHYFAVGRAYLQFYKSGLKNAYANFRLSVPIRRRIGLSTWFPSFPDIPPPSMAGAAIGVPLMRERRTARLSRAEYHLLQRSSYDLRRLVPFAFVLLICGELTPFVVLLPGVGNHIVPRVCLTPRQLDKEERAFASRKEKETFVYRGARYMDLKDSKAVRDLNAFAVSPTDALNATISLNLTRHTPPHFLVPLFTRILYQRRLSRHLTYLVWDDVLLRRDGGVDALCRAEVRIAILQRGGVKVLLRDSETDERQWLKTWLQGA